MYEVFVQWDTNLGFLQCYQNTIYIHIMDMSQLFETCLLHITLLQFQNFIKKHVILHYMVFCSKNHIKSCVGQYFLDTSKS